MQLLTKLFTYVQLLTTSIPPIQSAGLCHKRDEDFPYVSHYVWQTTPMVPLPVDCTVAKTVVGFVKLLGVTVIQISDMPFKLRWI